jgi:hypothetical protein
VIENIAQLLAALGFIGQKVSGKTKVYLIAGSALLWHNLKNSTSDVDICCDFQDANRIVTDLRPHGVVESVIGINNVHFLRIFLKTFVLEIFIRDVWTRDEYEILRGAQCDPLVFGDMMFLIPDIKTLLKIKDGHIGALHDDWKETRSEIRT